MKNSLFTGSYSFFKENLYKIVKSIYEKNPYASLTFVLYSNRQRLFVREFLSERLGILLNANFYTLIDIAKQITKKEPIIEAEKKLIIKRALLELNPERKEFADEISTVIKMIKEYQIDIDKISPKWIKEVFEKYQQLKEGFLDREDVINLASSIDTDFQSDYTFIVGFQSVLSLQEKFFKRLKQLTKENIFVFSPITKNAGYYQHYHHFKDINEFFNSITEVYKEEKREEENLKVADKILSFDYEGLPVENKNISLINPKNQSDEVEIVAKHIANLIVKQDIPPYKIGVVFPDIEEYLPYVKSSFQKYEIPYLLVEENRYLDFPKFQALFNIFLLKLKEFQQEIVEDVLIYDIIDEENLNSFIKKLKELPEEESLKTYISTFKELLNSLKDEELTQFLESVFLSLENNQLLKLFEKISFEDFVDIIKQFFLEEKKEEEIPRNAVAILTPTRALGNNFDYLFFCGLTSDGFPKNYSDDSVIGSVRLGKFEFPEHLFYQDVLNFVSLLDKGKKVILSFPSENINSQPKTQSVLIDEIIRITNIDLYTDWIYKKEQVLDKLKDLELPKDVKVKFARLLLEKDKEQSLKKEDFKFDFIKSLPEKISPTRFQVFVRCPYRFFYEEILKVEEEETLDETRISPKELGILIHKILEKLYRELDIKKPKIDQSNLRKWFYEGLEGIKGVNQLLDDVLPSYRPFEQKRMEKVFENLVSFTSFDIERQKRQGVEVDKSLLEEVLENELFRGRIDRADTDGSFYYIFDYKTSERKHQNIKKEIKENYIQLIIYKRLLEEKKGKGKVKEVGILSVNDPEKRFIYSTSDFDELEQFLNEKINLYLSKMFYPVESDFCSFCSFEDFCPKERLNLE